MATMGIERREATPNSLATSGFARTTDTTMRLHNRDGGPADNIVKALTAATPRALAKSRAVDDGEVENL